MKDIIKIKKKKFIVHDHGKGKCKVVFIPKDYCTVYMKGRELLDTEISKCGNSVCIENISIDNDCQKN